MRGFIFAFALVLALAMINSVYADASVDAVINIKCSAHGVNSALQKISKKLSHKLARQCVGVSASALSNVEVSSNQISFQADAETVSNIEACVENDNIFKPLRFNGCKLLSVESSSTCPANDVQFSGVVEFEVSFNGRGRRFSLQSVQQRNIIFRRIADVLHSSCNINACHLLLDNFDDICVVDDNTFELSVSSQEVADSIANCFQDADVPIQKKVRLVNVSDVSASPQCIAQASSSSASPDSTSEGSGSILNFGGGL